MQKIISFVISEAKKLKKGTVLEYKPSESAPKHSASAIPLQFEAKKLTKNIGGLPAQFAIRSYPPNHLLIEATIEVDDIFSENALTLREQLVEACQDISQKQGGSLDMSEEYSIALVSGYSGDPQQFFNKSPHIAAFLKSERIPLDDNEIHYTLSNQIKYGKDDLVIVDWDGAFVFDVEGKVDDVVNLFETANLQLLRYRSLDKELDERLHKVTRFGIVTVPTTLSLMKNKRDIATAFQEIIRVRTEAIADFEAIDRDIKLIGDWYSARLYDCISKKFKFDEWKRHVQEKLESLEDIYTIVAENFSVSRHQFLELIQILLFFVLQAGWFALIILEFFYFTK
ncbi:MAG TPA: hypothetical protein VJH33_02295 [Candidatus Paceibacterota bacterium]